MGLLDQFPVAAVAYKIGSLLDAVPEDAPDVLILIVVAVLEFVVPVHAEACRLFRIILDDLIIARMYVGLG